MLDTIPFTSVHSNLEHGLVLHWAKANTNFSLIFEFFSFDLFRLFFDLFPFRIRFRSVWMGLKDPSNTGRLWHQSELDDVSDVAKMGRQPIGSFWCLHVCFPSGLVSMNRHYRPSSGKEKFSALYLPMMLLVSHRSCGDARPKPWYPPALNIVGALDPGFVQTCSTWTSQYKPLSSDMFIMEPGL